MGTPNSKEIKVWWQREKTWSGPTFVYQPPNIFNVKLNEDLFLDISKCMEDQDWINVGRRLKLQNAKLKQIQMKNEGWSECAYQMLILWHQQKADSNLQDLFLAFEEEQWRQPILKVQKRVKKYLIIKSQNTPISKWSNLNPKIIQSILSKMTSMCYKNCSLIFEYSMLEKNEAIYTSWMKKNCNNWTESSFRNAMENGVNCKVIYWKSSEQWKRDNAPTVIKEIDTRYSIENITISEDGKLLAVCSNENITIYDSMDLRMQFSRDFNFGHIAIHFNGNNSYMMVAYAFRFEVVEIAEGLPTVHTEKRSHASIARFWFGFSIFLSGRYDTRNDKTTFNLNKIGKENDPFPPILMVKGEPKFGQIVRMDSCNLLVCNTNNKKLVFRTVSDNLTEYYSKQQLETPDHEVDCPGNIEDLVEVTDGNTKKLYILTDMKYPYKDFCFFIIDLDSFQLKTSTLLVPRHFKPCKNLVSNAKYMASGSPSDCVNVWDLKSHLRVAQLKHEDHGVSYAIHPIDPQLVITAGKDKKIKIWRFD